MKTLTELNISGLTVEENGLVTRDNLPVGQLQYDFGLIQLVSFDESVLESCLITNRPEWIKVKSQHQKKLNLV